MAKKIVIVDDALFMRESLKKILETNGFEVIGTANNGITALELLKEVVPDVITLDLTMPGMDGMQFLETIQKIDHSYKVVVVSAVAQEYNVTRAIELGAVDFIRKPYEVEKVINTLKRI